MRIQNDLVGARFGSKLPYRSTKLLIDQHGTEAPIHAAMPADAMLETGDMDGRAVA